MCSFYAAPTPPEYAKIMLSEIMVAIIDQTHLMAVLVFL